MGVLGWPFGPRQSLIVALAALLLFGMHPMRLVNRAAFLVYHTTGAFFKTVRLPAPPPTTLKAAILNVTTDFNQLTHVVQDFLRSPGVDPSVERQFRVFLAERAERSHPQLESALDWVLAVYRIMAPFVAISLLSRLFGGGEGEPAGQEHVAQRSRHAQRNDPRPRSQQQCEQQQPVSLPPVSTTGSSRKDSSAAWQWQVAGGHPPAPGTPQEQEVEAAAALRRQLDALAEPYRRRGVTEDASVLARY